MELYQRVIDYWSVRSDDFSRCRVNELQSERRAAWEQFFQKYLGDCHDKNVLDVGTGAGFFSIVMDRLAKSAAGIDGSETMLAHARENAASFGCKSVSFQKMDAQHLDFNDESFDILLSRNLTWTLPDAENAYREWFRVLRPGGILLNIDANYGEQFRQSSDPYAEIKKNAGSPFCPTMTKELVDERNAYAEQLDISHQARPQWDFDVLFRCGFQSITVETNFRLDYHLKQGGCGAKSRMFLIVARKN